MPVYDYKCREHGIFHDLATMAEASEPRPCPHCRKLSARIIMLPPQLMDMSPNKRKAMERNEKSAHEPIILTPDRQHEHRSGCGCSHHPDTSSLKQKAIYLPDGSKVFPSQRPWMISH